MGNHTHHTTAIWPPLLHNREPSPPQGFPRNPRILASTVAVYLTASKSHCSVFTGGPAFRARLLRLLNLISLETLFFADCLHFFAPFVHGIKLVKRLKISSLRPTRLPGTVAVGIYVWLTFAVSVRWPGHFVL